MVDSVKDLSKVSDFNSGLADDMIALTKGMTIEIFHIPSGKIVKFKAMISDYSDSFTTNYASEEVYGRMDPMVNFTNTVREINLGWSLPAASEDEARLNLQKCSLLISMLYPSYAVGGGATAIAAGPLFKLKFANLIADGVGGVQTNGLIGTIGGFEFTPDLEVGFFDRPGVLLPKRIDCSIGYQVLHSNPMGWTDEENPKWRGDDGSGKWLYGEEFPPGTESEDFRTAGVAPAVKPTEVAKIFTPGAGAEWHTDWTDKDSRDAFAEEMEKKTAEVGAKSLAAQKAAHQPAPGSPAATLKKKRQQAAPARRGDD